ncbi:MAG: hypothetical protein AAB451_00520, partial [Patescibacteria group bacterium]
MALAELGRPLVEDGRPIVIVEDNRYRSPYLPTMLRVYRHIDAFLDEILTNAEMVGKISSHD